MYPQHPRNIPIPVTPVKRSAPCTPANIDELIELVTKLEDFVSRADSVLAALEQALDIDDIDQDTETEEDDSSGSDEQ